ncbi:MAG: 6-aminohexanoate hydrolase, partial [Sulfitobacter sp.]|nr:6-aminohexanoate hydrolase [Sulfitobacter sp.]
MRSFGKWLGRGLLALILAAVVIGLWKREEITRLLAVNSLFSEGKIVRNFSNMNAAFLSIPVPRGNSPTSTLTYGPETSLPEEVDRWVKDRHV